ncbi:MAG: Cna B-type domain-containing protein, partial [Oscillospiraceae bacterium]|nr:Cna B-type domain-containing protein [Oscillospiraceae bacterium]
MKETKKKLSDRILAAAASAAVAVTCATVPVFSEETNTPMYNKTIDYTSVFSDFQYFVSGDASLLQHQVGAIYIGGKGSLGCFGDGTIHDSYVHDLQCITNFQVQAGHYLPPSLAQKKSESLYVGNTLEQLQANYAIPSYHYQNTPQIIKPVGNKAFADPSAFSVLIGQSTALEAEAVNSNVSYEDDIITIDFTDAESNASLRNVEIPASWFNDNTRVLFKGIDDVTDFEDDQYTINVTGIGANDFNFDFTRLYYNYIHQYDQNINMLNNDLREHSKSFGSVEVLLEGSMKLVWNMPDATGTVNVHRLTGHLLAPKAAVNADYKYSGHHEGGIIAASVTANSSEGHFYPYMQVGSSKPSPEINNVGQVELIKTYKINNEVNLNVTENQLANTKFILTELDNSGVPVSPLTTFTANPYKVYDEEENVTGYQVVFLGTELKADTNYKIEEVCDTYGNTVDGYKAQVGKVFYAHTPTAESDNDEVTTYGETFDSTHASYITNVPVFVNEKTVNDKAIIKFTKTDGTSGLNGAGFTLYSNEECTSSARVQETISQEDGTVAFTEIAEGTYYIKETQAPKGYNASSAVYKVQVDINENGISTVKFGGVDDDVLTLDTVEVENTLITRDISVEKVWEDNSNASDKRPAELEVYLYADGVKIKTEKLNAAGSWKHSFTGLPVYASGKEIVYTVGENAVPGYENVSTVYNSDSKTFVITNKIIDETTDITVTKIWEDSDDKYSKRPDEIIVNLLADGSTFDSVKLNGSNKWTYTFKGLKKHNKNGSEIKYSVKELNVPAYKSDVSESVPGEFVITNTIITSDFGFKKVAVEKTSDENSILIAGAEFTLTSDDTDFEEKATSISTDTITNNVIFTGIPYGTYTMTETTMPGEEYAVNNAKYKVEVTSDGVVITEKESDENGKLTGSKDNYIIQNVKKSENEPDDDPEETDPSETDPKETDPKETDPKETDPKETDPSETDPKETDPKETDPSETDPKETDPKETDPKETDPKETD